MHNSLPAAPQVFDDGYVEGLTVNCYLWVKGRKLKK